MTLVGDFSGGECYCKIFLFIADVRQAIGMAYTTMAVKKNNRSSDHC